MSLITDEIRASASEFYTGDEICQVESKHMLTEMGFPNGILPLKDMVECGYVEKTGFMWLLQKKKTEHKFEKIGRIKVEYATEVTAYVENKKVKRLTGVKAKELLIWLNVCDIYVDDRKITFKSPTGLTRTFPVLAFELEEEPTAVKGKEVNVVIVKEAHAGAIDRIFPHGIIYIYMRYKYDDSAATKTLLSMDLVICMV